MNGIIALIGKLVGIASLGEALSGLHLARKFVIDLALVIMLVVIGSMMAGALCIGALWECHELLSRHGVGPDMAAFYTALFGLSIIGSLGGLIAFKIQKMQSFPFSFAQKGLGSLGNTSIHSIVNGFYKGITHKKP